MRRVTLALAALATASCGNQPTDADTGNVANALRNAQIHASRGSAPGFPNLSSTLYCARFAAGAGTPALEKTCNDAEAAARKDAMTMSIPAMTMTYCTKTAEAVGGSYQAFKLCVEKQPKSTSDL